MEQETIFLKDILKSRGLLPTPSKGRGKDTTKDVNELNKRKKSGTTKSSASKKNSAIKSQAIVIERNGELSSPFVK